LCFVGCFLGFTLASCSKATPPGPSEPSAKAAARRLTWKKAEPPNDLLAQIRSERDAVLRQNPKAELIVYVGATWCEPCTRFHDAALRGDLDARYGNLTVLEYDHDRDKDALKAAGYVDTYIPVFALPAADGRPQRSFAGSIKGPEGLTRILSDLEKLLSDKRPE
jgi:hypothetical protein